MENAVDALKIAGSVLLFVMALSVVMPLLSQARTTADAIMSYADRQGDAIGAGETYEKQFFYVGDPAKKSRTVGIGEVIPTIYRALEEKFKVVFVENNLNNPIAIYKYKGTNNLDKNDRPIELNRIDAACMSATNHEQQKEFINGILYNDWGTKGTQTQFQDDYMVELNNNITNPSHKGLYGYLNYMISLGKTIEEYAGVYYSIDLTEPDNDVPESNKLTERVVTYLLKT